MSEFIRARIEIAETAATVASDGRFTEIAVDAIKAARKDVERQIRKDRFFLTTIEPYVPSSDASPLIKRMCRSAEVAGVGPMATVAGAIAQHAMEAMVSAGCTHGWVDNGGDVALILDSPVLMEVFSEPGSTEAFALELEPTDGIVGICSSSGRLGHSISFGDSDIALVIADDAILADALATACGNRVLDQASLRTCFEPFMRIDGFIGGLVMKDGAVGMAGKLPRLVEVEHNPERITAHSSMSAAEYLGHSQSTEVRD